MNESYDHFSPRVGAVYKLSDTFRIRGNVGQAFKSPAPDELSAQYEYESWYGTTRRILGNPDLKPETSMTYEIGADYSIPSVTFGTSYFYTKSKDRIVSDPAGVEYDGKIWDTYKNTSGTYVQGIDLNVEWEAGKSLDRGDIYDARRCGFDKSNPYGFALKLRSEEMGSKIRSGVFF